MPSARIVTGARAAVAIVDEVDGASEGSTALWQPDNLTQLGVMTERFGEPLPVAVIVADAFCDA